MARKRNGPAVFCLAVGICLALGGLMTFLAVPAAFRLDQKEAYYEEAPMTDQRQRGVVTSATVITLSGLGLAAVGGLLLFRTSRH